MQLNVGCDRVSLGYEIAGETAFFPQCPCCKRFSCFHEIDDRVRRLTRPFSSFIISQISQKMALDLFPLDLIQWIRSAAFFRVPKVLQKLTRWRA